MNPVSTILLSPETYVLQKTSPLPPLIATVDSTSFKRPQDHVCFFRIFSTMLKMKVHFPDLFKAAWCNADKRPIGCAIPNCWSFSNIPHTASQSRAFATSTNACCKLTSLLHAIVEVITKEKKANDSQTWILATTATTKPRMKILFTSDSKFQMNVSLHMEP